MTLKPGKIHVLADVISRAPHVMEKIDDGLICVEQSLSSVRFGRVARALARRGRISLDIETGRV